MCASAISAAADAVTKASVLSFIVKKVELILKWIYNIDMTGTGTGTVIEETKS